MSIEKTQQLDSACSRSLHMYSRSLSRRRSRVLRKSERVFVHISLEARENLGSLGLEEMKAARHPRLWQERVFLDEVCQPPWPGLKTKRQGPEWT